MTTLPRRTQGMLVTAGLAIVAAVVGAVILFSSSKANNVDLTAAGLVPEDAVLYAGFNTDLSSGQWVSAFKLVERLGQEDPEGELKRALAEDGTLDWDEDVAPFLGGDAAVFMTSLTETDEFTNGAVIVRCKDAGKALAALIRQADTSFTKKTYGGFEYQIGLDGEGYVVVIGDHLVVSGSEETLKSVIDVKNGKTKSIANLEAFKALRDDLTRDFIAFVYVDTKRVIDDTFLAEPILREAFDKAASQDILLKPFAAAVTAANAGFAAQAATGAEGAAADAMKPRESRFAKMVPARTTIFFSTAGLAKTWADTTAGGARKEIDDALASGPFGTLEDALREAGRPLGLDSIEEVIALLTGETAVAVWMEDSTTDSAEGLLLAEVADDAKARDVLKKLFAKSQSRIETIAGKEVVLARNGNDAAAYVVADGYALIGTEAAVRAVLDGGPNLAGAAKYQHTRKALSTPMGSFLYLDMHALLLSDAASSAVPVDAVAENLEGFIVNYVQDGGLARVSAVLSVKE